MWNKPLAPPAQCKIGWLWCGLATASCWNDTWMTRGRCENMWKYVKCVCVDVLKKCWQIDRATREWYEALLPLTNWPVEFCVVRVVRVVLVCKGVWLYISDLSRPQVRLAFGCDSPYVPWPRPIPTGSLCQLSIAIRCPLRRSSKLLAHRLAMLSSHRATLIGCNMF